MSKLRNILGVLFVTLYLCHYVSNNFFIHTHYFKWGKVTHSHPFIPVEGNAEHNHSAAQLNFLSGANQQNYLSFEFAHVPVLFLVVLFTLIVCRDIARTQETDILLKGRSPPSC